jgi:hypothetical protein
VNWGAAGITVLGLLALETLETGAASNVNNLTGLLGGPAKLVSWIVDPTIPAFSSASTDALLDPAGQTTTPAVTTPATGSSPAQTILGISPPPVAITPPVTNTSPAQPGVYVSPGTEAD